MKTLFSLLLTLMIAFAANSQSLKKPGAAKIVRQRITAESVNPAAFAGDEYKYVDDEAAVNVTREAEGKNLRVTVTVVFRLATSERGQARQEVLMLGGYEGDTWQKVTAESHSILLGGAKLTTIEEYRVYYYAGVATLVASMDAKTSLLGRQALNRGVRFVKLAYEQGEKIKIEK